MSNRSHAIVVALIIFGSLVVSFFATAGLTWLVCWAFGWLWSWKLSVGVWALLCLISGAVKSSGRK